MKTVVFGAGRIGRGLLGQLFTGADRELVFADVNLKLIRQLNARHSYVLRLVWYDESMELFVRHVRAIDVRNIERVATELSNANLAATAVGAAALLQLIPPVAAGIEARARTAVEQPLNILFCENMLNATEIFGAALRNQLSPAARSYLDEYVGLVGTVVNRIVPGVTPRDAADETMVMAEPGKALFYDAAAFRGPVPAIDGLVAIDDFRAEINRKLFIHNMAHAVVAYLGYHQGHHYIYSAVRESDIRAIVTEAMQESSQALSWQYHSDAESQHEYGGEFLERLANPALLDPVWRVARDPLRKLAPNERLVTPARWALRYGIEPCALAWGIAAALAYNDPHDQEAQQLQKLLQRESLEKTLRKVCDIEARSHLGQLVIARYRSLKEHQGLEGLEGGGG